MARVSRALLPPLGSAAGPAGGESAGAAEAGEAGRGAAPPSLSPPSGSLAKSLQRAEALWRHCVPPGLKRLLPPPGRTESAEEGSSSSEEEREDSRPSPARVERAFQGLSRCLCVQEDPRTETFRGHLRPEAAQGPFSFHAARAGVAHRCATLHALLQHRHRLLLSRHYSRRLQAASEFVRRLGAAERRPPPACGEGFGQGRLLRELCEELRAHAAHWDGLRRRLRSDPWLRPLLLQRHEAVLHMKQALSLLVLHAARLLERYAEALLRGLARAGPPPPPGSFSDFFQGLEVYNQVVGGRALQRAFLELQAPSGAGCGLRLREAGSCRAFPVERVLGILAAERGSAVAQKLHPRFLWWHAGAVGVEPVPWESSARSWPSDGDSLAGEGPLSLLAALQALCQEEEEFMLLLLGELVASSGSLWHHVLNRPKQEKPLECRNPSEALGESESASLPSWKSVRWLDTSFTEAAAVLYAQYCPLLWRAAASSLAYQLELHLPLTQFQEGAAATLGQLLSHTLAEAHVPPESAEELQSLSLRLLMREVLQHWDQGFCCALGSSLTDKCVVKPAQGTGAACSPTAWCLQSLCLPLAFSLRCLDAQQAESAGLRLEVLSLLVATSHTSCYWVMSKAYQHLASWSLSQFLLVTQGDLQLLKAETDKMLTLVSTDLPKGRKMQSPLASQQELELNLQIHSTATRIQLFARDVLQLFSSDCKRMSAEIFGQTMPLGKHWRLALRTELPSSPSEYASAAAQTVLGQVLQGIQLLPRDAQVPALGQVTTAFLEAWMEHILSQKIRFSLQGALQLKQDFNLVRELLHSEDYGLSPEIRQLVLSLRVFQQVDNAIACLLQQPSKASLPLHTWDAFRKCCSYNGIHTQEGGPGSLNSLESLEGLPVQVEASLPSQAGDLLSRVQGGGCSPETYLSPTQQEWLALRLHGGRRWKVPGLPCMSRTSEP